MKKFFELLLAVLVAVMPMASLAESGVAWDQSLVDAMGIEGDFYALEEMGLGIWLPSSMEPVEVSDEDAADGIYAMMADDERALVITVRNEEGLTLDQAYENVVSNGYVKAEIENVNGLDALIYFDEENNVAHFGLVDSNSNMIMFSFTPIDTEEAEDLAVVVFSSIMPLE